MQCNAMQCNAMQCNAIQYKLYFPELHREFSQIESIMRIFIKNDKKRILSS